MSEVSDVEEDLLLRGVIRSSGRLFSANSLSLGLTVLQGVLIARLLQPEGLGLLRVVMVYASTVNSLFSFRMSELVVRYGVEYIGHGENEKTAALIKVAGLAEGLVSVLAFFAVVLTSGFAQRYFTETSGIAWLFILYAVGLLANFNVETSTGVLQLTHKIEWQGVLNFAQNILALAIIVAAYLLKGPLLLVLCAYLIGKIILGLGMFVVAQMQLTKLLGPRWRQVSRSNLTSTREMVRFAISSNLSASIIKVFRESELLWVAFFLPTSAVGLYSVAYSLVSFLAVPADPLIATTFPEINRLVVQKSWSRLKDLLRRITSFSAAYNLVLGIALVAFGRWIISLYAGANYLAAFPTLVALTMGVVFNYILFWNRPLLLSLGLPDFPVWVTLTVGLVKLSLAFLLIPRFGIVAAGALLSFYYIASVAIMVLRGLKEIRARELLG